MWEWRYFYLENEVPLWVNNVGKYLKKSQEEQRSDLYYNLGSSDYGLKVRNLSKSPQLLELKILYKKKLGLEYWQKSLKTPINSISINRIVDILQNYQDSHYVKVINLLKSRENNQIFIEKTRYKSRINDISVEKVIMKIRNMKWGSVQLESDNYSSLRNFVEQEIIGNEKIPQNTSYPLFLLQL